jgi:RNA polymerase sigma factor (sigma-70 family)
LWVVSCGDWHVLGIRGNLGGSLRAYVDVTVIGDPPDPNASCRTSFEAVYLDSWLPMVRLAALTTGSTEIAEQIVQDAFVQLLRNWTTVTSPKAWLRIAVINGGRGWLRRQYIERRHADQWTTAAMPDEGVVVREALRKLSARQRAAIVLRYYEDLTELEIAETLRCRPGTVKSLLDRANRTLRRELQP